MILDEIIANKRIQIEQEKKLSGDVFVGIDALQVRDFKASLMGNGISIIGEIKKASPSKGTIIEEFDVEKIAGIYEALPIDAISVLTEKKYFKGDDRYIQIVKGITSKPVLRKDFIIDAFQIDQAKAIGADAILLIEEVLGTELEKFYSLATQMGLHCLVEVHSERALYHALTAGCEIIGINNRDLTDFSVDLKTTENLMKKIPQYVCVVSESGIKTTEDIKYLSAIGVNGVLIGETFMRSIHDIGKVTEFIAVAKGA